MRPGSLEDTEPSAVASFVEITVTMAAMALGAGVCSGLFTRALLP